MKAEYWQVIVNTDNTFGRQNSKVLYKKKIYIYTRNGDPYKKNVEIGVPIVYTEKKIQNILTYMTISNSIKLRPRKFAYLQRI